MLETGPPPPSPAVAAVRHHQALAHQHGRHRGGAVVALLPAVQLAVLLIRLLQKGGGARGCCSSPDAQAPELGRAPTARRAALLVALLEAGQRAGRRAQKRAHTRAEAPGKPQPQHSPAPRTPPQHTPAPPPGLTTYASSTALPRLRANCSWASRFLNRRSRTKREAEGPPCLQPRTHAGNRRKAWHVHACGTRWQLLASSWSPPVRCTALAAEAGSLNRQQSAASCADSPLARRISPARPHLGHFLGQCPAHALHTAQRGPSPPHPGTHAHPSNTPKAPTSTPCSLCHWQYTVSSFRGRLPRMLAQPDTTSPSGLQQCQAGQQRFHGSSAQTGSPACSS